MMEARQPVSDYGVKTKAFATIPEAGKVITVAPGVLWVRMPLPFVLNHINLWLIEDDDGWTVVDTGVNSSEIRNNWEKVFADHLKGKPVTRVVVTHLHPDHVGLAGWITRKFDIDLWMSRTDYLMCRNLVQDKPGNIPPEAIEFYHAAGFTEAQLKRYKERFGGFGTAISELPASFHRLRDRDVLTIGGREWHVVVGAGHAPEHVCLFCPDLNLLMSGDQVLPRISSIVSLFPTEPFANPLQDWLDSCADLKSRLPEDALVLPAHNEPFFGLHARLDELIAEHEENLERLRERCKEPKRAVDVFDALFKREITEDLVHMATGESLAHLNCLIARGEITRSVDGNGIAWYRYTA